MSGRQFILTPASVCTTPHVTLHRVSLAQVLIKRTFPALLHHFRPAAQLVMTCTNVRNGELHALEAGDELYISYGELESAKDAWIKFGFVR